MARKSESGRKSAIFSLGRKIPSFIILAALTATILIGAAALWRAGGQLETEAENKLGSLAEARTVALEQFLNSLRADLKVIAAAPITVQAMNFFTLGYNTYGTDPSAGIRKLFIDDNPNPPEKRELLDDSKDSGFYNSNHKKLHPFFREILQRKGYEDIILVNDEGNVIYTVKKNDIFATNLNDGPYKDSAVSSLFHSVMKDTGEDSVGMSDFAIYKVNGAPAAFIGAPVFKAPGKPIGVLIFQMPVKRINDVMTVAAGLGETGETLIVGADFKVRSDSRLFDKPTLLTREVRSTAAEMALGGESTALVETGSDGVERLVVARPLTYLGVKWAVLARQDMSEILAPVARLRNEIAIIGLILFAVIGILGLFAARGIVRPLGRMTAAMTTLAGGDLSADIPAIKRKDELGDMARAVAVFKENALAVKRLEAEHEENRRKSEEEKQSAMRLLADEFEKSVKGIVDGLVASISEMREAAQSMNTIASDTDVQATTVAAAAEETSVNVRTVAAAAENLSLSIRDIDQKVSHSSEVAGAAGKQAQATNEHVSVLAEAAQKIGEIVGMISDIAEQTNLLALNATIEAARAGEAGKGFAVVASEVKNLAGQTAKATEEISAQVNGIQGATGEAVSAIQTITATVTEINEVAATITEAIRAQGEATVEISENVQQAAAGTQEVSSTIGTVTSAAGQAKAFSGTLLNAATRLSEQAESLGSEVDRFLNSIRST